MDKQVVVIADVHGCYKTLMALVAQVPKDTEIAFVGDLIDRGPMSMEVVEFVKSNGYKCVKGNHESALADFILKFDSEASVWQTLSEYGWLIKNGVDATLKSYGIDPDLPFKEVIDKIADNDKLIEHAEWMSRLPTYIEFNDVVNAEGKKLVISHSSVHSVWDRKDAPAAKNFFNETLMWNRINPITDVAGVYNLFGHTPHDEPRITSHYANIDTGCCFANETLKYSLTAMSFPNMIIYKQENIE